MPSRGRTPGGAKNNERNAASRSMPSDWYDENSCAAETNDKKHTPATAIANLGHRLKRIASDAAMPTQTRTESARSLAPNQRSEGMYRYARHPSASRAAGR